MHRSGQTETEQRALRLGEYIAETGATVRGAAAVFGVSKSTVHKDVADRLRGVDPDLYVQVKAVLDENKAQRHIRGGEATRRKYSSMAGAKTRAKLHTGAG